jgi:hypothetical protein
MKPQNVTRYLRFILILLIVSGMSSCYKDRFDLNRLEKGGEWSPDVAVPLVYSNMTMKDILDDYDHDNLFVEDGSGFLYLVYTNNIFSQKAEDLLVIQNQPAINTSINFSVTGPLPYGIDTTIAPNIIYCSFTMPNSAVIDELDVKNGMFDFTLYSPNLNHNATIDVSIPSATLNGVPFNQSVDFTAGSTSSPQLSLNGYKIIFDNTGGNQNRLAIIYTVTLHGSGGPNNSPYNINLGESFNNIKFSKILGDFKQIPFDLPDDTVGIRIFNKTIEGSVNFENPMVHVYAYNSFGMPIQLNINSFVATNGPPGTTDVPLAGAGIPSPWNISGASGIGQVAETQFDLDKTNSNIWDAIAIAPKKFVADISGMSNPGGGISNNFALDTSRLKVDAQIEIPMFGKALNFILGDTIDLEFGQDMDKVEFMLFKINTTNGFPVEAIQQLYFIDEAGHPIDSLLVPEQQTLTAAPCNGAPDYRVTQSVLKSTESRFEHNRVVPLKNCKKIVIRARLLTTQSGTQLVKFYSDYSLLVRIALRVKFNVNY